MILIADLVGISGAVKGQIGSVVIEIYWVFGLLDKIGFRKFTLYASKFQKQNGISHSKFSNQTDCLIFANIFPITLNKKPK